jgi:hypothetical protein
MPSRTKPVVYDEPVKFRGVIKEITYQGADAKVTFELHNSKKTTVCLPADAAVMMGLKKDGEICAVVAAPVSGIDYNSGQRIATIKVDKKWVTIPYGPYPPVGNPNEAETLTGDKLAQLYGYKILNDFLEVVNAVPGTGCGPKSVLFEIETVREYNTWVTFPSGPHCEARIKNLRDQHGSGSSSEEAWAHRYTDLGDYMDAKNKAWTDNVPTLAGIKIGNDAPTLPVNCYINGKKICQIKVG